MAGLSNQLKLKKIDYKDVILIGTVVDNNDPEKLERVRVKIPDLYDNMEDTDLPWAIPVYPRKHGATPDSGEFGNIPAVGSTVYVKLQNGDATFPTVVGSVLDVNNRLPDGGINYPNRYGFVDAAGNVFYIDTTPGSVEVFFRHKSGTKIEINDAGELTITGVDNVNINSDLDTNITVKGATNITSDGDVTVDTPNAIVIADTIDLGGSSTEPLVLGTEFMTFLNNYFTAEYNAHIHPTGVGPSGPPVTPATPMTPTQLSPQNTTL